MEKEINKNAFYNQEISTKELQLKTKIFNYFYLILNKKNTTNKFTLCFLHMLEFIQIISFAFYEPHLNTWKVSKNNIRILSIIISSFRLAPIINFTSFKVFQIILIILIFIIFCFFLILIMQILFRKEDSKIYKGLLSITHLLIAPLTIFLYIPINEYLLLIFKCYNNDDINEINLTNKCWSDIHLLFLILSLIAVILLFSCLVFLNFFYYYPFQTETSTIKLNSNLDIISLIVKFGFLLRLNFIKDEYLSIIILLLFSFVLTFEEIKNPTYNCNLLEIVITIRNSLSLWTFFILFTAKVCENTDINGLIYLVFIGYPIIIVASIMYIKEYENEFNFKTSNNFHNIKSCLSKTRILIMLINSFLDKNNINRKYMEYGNKNDILLKGIIKMHTEICLDEECPLKKFIKNYGNFNVQKQCLLNYMSFYFNSAMKNFPYNKILRLYYIQFNFSKRYNLNSVRTNLEYIKKMKNNIKEEFIIYYLENEIIKVKNRILNSNDGNELEHEYMILGQNYKRLKYLIINITKLYVEFWGTFSINITNNLNIFKLNKIGEQLNIYLNEINYLWENNLKNKKINIENESVAQLYSKFLKEILWDKKGSEEVQKKINEEYHMQGYKRIIHENKKLNNINNIENMIENQDNVLFVNSNEKGKCNIIQFSNSLSYLIGYQKQEIINKPLEILMPSIFIEGHAKKVEDFIRTNHLNRISKDSFREIDKKKSFILIKSKMGYLIPFNAKYTVFDDNDFSNSYLIKAHLEPRDIKSMYAYYILTKNDFSIDNISSSAINLGLTMDLLKKYVIKLNILIRTSKDNELNLFEKYKYFEEEPKKINWVYPDIIYPKNDLLKNKDKKMEDLIKASYKKKFNLQIFEMKYKPNEIIGFVFKFIDIQTNKNKKKNEIIFQELLPRNKSEIIFDLLTLSYIRTILVKEKTGLRNLRDNKIENDIKSELKTKRKKATEYFDSEALYEGSSNEEENKIELTKDKILELQTKDSTGIQNLINLLPFYGHEITLIKHRPNKDEYLAGKTREPLIKIDANNFIKRLEHKLKDTFYRKLKNIRSEKRGSLIINENQRIKSKFVSSIQNDNENNNKEKNEINKNLIGDSSVNLTNIFNERSIFHIKLVNSIIYVIIFLFFIIEFYISYIYINNTKKRFNYLDNSIKILVNLVYCKYFIMEAIFTNSIPNYLISLKVGKSQYIKYIKSELSNYHKELTDLLEIYYTNSKKFSKNITDYMSSKNITIKTLNNGIQKDEEQPLISALNRLSTSIFYVSTISDLESINMTDKHSYELMINLLNGYYMTCSDINNLIFDEIQSNDTRILRKSITFISFIISFFSLFSYYKIMQNFMYDLKKPINLFLTIKKQLFENLKYTAESFSNKLLNKFFGNEENEEESQQDSTIIKSNDINIAKFKTIHEYKSLKKGYSLMFYFGQLLAVLTIFEIYNILKYFYFGNYISQLYKFNDVYMTTQISHEYIVIRINIIKQYFFNSSLSNFNLEEKYINLSFFNSFHDLSSKFTETILKTSNTDSFLKSEYIELFREYLYKNFSDSINNNDIKNDIKYADKIVNGFKSIKIEVFEILRSLFIQYFHDNKKNNNNISELINNEKWYDLHEMLVNIIKPWYEYIIKQLTLSLYSSLNKKLTVNISIFILMIVLHTIVYCIIWKSYEEKLHNLLKKSYDLINLIPKEIKYIIVPKLNE